jgi:hypothetical protein
MESRIEELRRQLSDCQRIASITTEEPILKGLARFASDLEEEIREEEAAASGRAGERG